MLTMNTNDFCPSLYCLPLFARHHTSSSPISDQVNQFTQSCSLFHHPFFTSPLLYSTLLYSTLLYLISDFLYPYPYLYLLLYLLLYSSFFCLSYLLISSHLIKSHSLPRGGTSSSTLLSLFGPESTRAFLATFATPKQAASPVRIPTLGPIVSCNKVTWGEEKSRIFLLTQNASSQTLTHTLPIQSNPIQFNLLQYNTIQFN